MSARPVSFATLKTYTTRRDTTVPKSEAQQGKAMMFRTRTRMVHQRTELINMLRAFLYECGHTVPKGIHQFQRIEAIVTEQNSDLSVMLARNVASFSSRLPP